jgi:putative transcriptional regulator
MPDLEEPSDIVVMSIEEVRQHSGRVNWAIINATTDADIERQAAEDDHPPPESLGRARLPNAPEVTQLRATFGISQGDFAARFGIGLRTLQQWEQRRRAPEGPARLLLRIIADHPDIVERVASSIREESTVTPKVAERS